MKYVLVLAASFLLGSIPFGLLFGKLWAKIDVREYGSGNIGMTNVLRSVGYAPAVLTLLGDVGKGMLAVLIAQKVVGVPFFALLAGFCAVLGHNWSIFLGLRGGKGVATIAGMLLISKPIIFAILAAIWLLVLVVSRYISLASIICALALPVVLLFFKVSWPELALAILISVLTIIRHRTNITRLKEGNEFRFGQKV